MAKKTQTETKKTTVCLTGATGHVGYAILKELQGHEEKDIRILVRRDPGIFEGLRCEMRKGDITDYESLLRAFEGCDIVYHIAGCVEIKPGNEEFVYNVNVNGTKNVLRACRKAGVKRLVYMSSVDTYVPLPEGEVMTEVYEYDPDKLEGAYAKTKAEATALVLEANGKGGLTTVVCQPSACMGPYDFKISSVGSMIRMFASGAFPITMTFGGYNFVDVRDVAIGTVAAGDKGGDGEVYLLVNTAVTVDEFIRILAKVSGNKPPRIKLGKGLIDFAAPIMETYYKTLNKPAIFTRYAVRKLCSNCNFSFAKAERELGYHPRPLEESIKDTLDWLVEFEESEKRRIAAETEQRKRGAEEAAAAAKAAAKAAEEAAAAAEAAEAAAVNAEEAANAALLEAEEKERLALSVAHKNEKRVEKAEKKKEKRLKKKQKEAEKAEKEADEADEAQNADGSPAEE
ncbi:MAG: NAD-dependent epimerase/dehydratase family protein [Clostridia bacterium]|nr:NAD-dependent epimerase/dehydratase family protein [Clostridia bacterium]